MAKLIMTRGLPGSGKSSWAREQPNCVIITKDDIRTGLEKTEWKWSRENEKDVIASQEKSISFFLDDGRNVIAADTNFGRHENRLRTLANCRGAEFEIKDFTWVPLNTCLERNRLREGKDRVPNQVIRDMYKKYIDPTYTFEEVAIQKVEKVPGLPDAIICDLDGTLALFDGLRSPYDSGKCEVDKVNKPIEDILVAMASKFGARPIFVSGREDKYRPQTKAWLRDAGWKGELLFMRPTGDFRKDDIVKLELFNNNIRGKYNVLFVLDDRDRVVKMWRDLGLTCLQVAYGNF